MKTLTPIFALGATYATPAALEVVNRQDLCNAITRHNCGDWGDLLCDDDKAANDAAVLELERIVSLYEDRRGVKFYIVTEADRSITTAFLPDEY